MKADIEQLVMRSVVAMLRVGAGSSDSDARDDIIDDALALFRALIAGDSDALACASREAITRIEAVGSDDSSAARALVLLLRLSSRVKPAEPTKAAKKSSPDQRPSPVPRASVGRPRMPENQARIVAYIKENPGIRTGELRALCAGQLSDRTVLRSLKELVVADVVERIEEENGTVYYRLKSEI